jgi:hypothetical protein
MARHRMNNIDNVWNTDKMLFNSDNRWIGYLGEIIFSRYIKQPTPNILIGDNGKDFKINNIIIDVKTAKKNTNTSMNNLIQKGYFIRLVGDVKKNIDYFVYIIIDGKKAFIIGCVSKKKLMTYPIVEPEFLQIKKPSYKMPLSDFDSMSELFNNKPINEQNEYTEQNNLNGIKAVL